MRLEADGVGYEYAPVGDGTTARLSLSFSIPTGSKVALLGPSGSGKSTTITLLAGLLAPSTGVLRYDGKEVRTPGDWRRLRPRIGISLQQPETQFFAATVWDEVMFAPLNYGIPLQEAKRMAHQALTRAYLDPQTYGPQSPFSLSGGEQRRVALASVLVMQPTLLLLDEPLAGMDASSAQIVWRGVTDYLNSGACTCIVATHDITRIRLWADRLLILDAGRIRFNGPMSEYKPFESDAAGFSCQSQMERLRSLLNASGRHIRPEDRTPEALAEAVYLQMGMAES